MSQLTDNLRVVRNAFKCWKANTQIALGMRQSTPAPIRFVVEDANWAIRWVGENIRDKINAATPNSVEVATTPEGAKDKVVHFGSQYMWLTWGWAAGRSNRYVVSFFHGKHEDGPEVSRHIDQFLDSVPRLSRIVASNSIVHQRLLSWGVDEEKIVRIPIGVDTTLFVPPTPEQRSRARRKFSIPDNAIVIGSFQKDGVGWGDGMEPKLIKGPDIYIETLKRLSESFPVFAMLTGPARGYVKAGLEANGIPYAHSYPETHAELVECYHTLDLYLVSSREEGGPMGLMESMATHVPVAATNVGMAPDLIQNGLTGALDLSISAEGLTEKAASLLNLSADQSANMVTKAHANVLHCDWSIVSQRHMDEVYHPLVHDNSGR